MAGVYDGVVAQWEQLGSDRCFEGGPVREGAPGRAGSALEQRVAGEDAAQVLDQEAASAGRVAGGVQGADPGPGDLELPAVRQVQVPEVVAVGELPERLVVGVQEDRRDHGLAQSRRDPAVVVVGVGQQDRLHGAAADDGEDVVDRVGRIDDDALVVVTHHPDVVVDVEGLAIQREGAAETAWSTRRTPPIRRRPLNAARRSPRGASSRTPPRCRRCRSPR